MEVFYTLQGEGAWTGHAAHFIRLGGCDVGCVWCDVKESWDASQFPQLTVSEIINPIRESKCKRVVITGGEPAMYDLAPLTRQLKAGGFMVHIETSGCYPLKGQFDWVCFSPKKFKAPITGFGGSANELKIIIFNKSDLEWAETFKNDCAADCKLYLQPEWSKKEAMNPLIVAYIKEHPYWQASLQTHKYLDIP
jgi:organic radical activating enzyme